VQIEIAERQRDDGGQLDLQQPEALRLPERQHETSRYQDPARPDDDRLAVEQIL